MRSVLQRLAGIGPRTRVLMAAGAVGVLVIVSVVATNDELRSALEQSTGLELVGATATVTISNAYPEPAVVNWNGNLYVYVLASDNNLYSRYRTSSGWTSWVPLSGGPFVSAPAAAAGPNYRYVYAQRSDGNLYALSGGSALGGPFGYGAAAYNDFGAFGRAKDRVYLYARGSDSSVYRKDVASGAGWTQVSSGTVSSAPAVSTHCRNESEYHCVFAKRDDNAFWFSFQGENGLWTPWNSLGGQFTSAPAVAGPNSTLFGPYSARVFGRGTDNALWYTSVVASELQGQMGSTWNPWRSLGGVLTSGPSATFWSTFTGNYPSQYGVHVFARGSDQALWYITETCSPGDSASSGLPRCSWGTWTKVP